jgi:hypothetical protein
MSRLKERLSVIIQTISVKAPVNHLDKALYERH